MGAIDSAKKACNRVIILIWEFLKTIVDIVLFVLSFKVFPLAWHARSYYSFLFRNRLNKRPVPLSTFNVPTIFQPTIWTSGTPLGEIDIMGHKTNSTYATDCDAARNYHISSLFRVGWKAWGEMSFINPQSRDGGGEGMFFPALAGSSFVFHKAIRPRQKYEICTRVLSWDEKWLHLVSHFVKKGSCKAKYLSDQKGCQLDAELSGSDCADWHGFGQREEDQSAVFATCMAKMVFKKGRKTISPERFLVDCGLLPSPERSANHETSGDSDSNEKLADENMKKLEESIENTRRTGHQIAVHLNALQDGSSLFNLSEKLFFSKC